MSTSYTILASKLDSVAVYHTGSYVRVSRSGTAHTSSHEPDAPQRTCANPQARSRHARVAGAIEVRPVTTRSALPAGAELQDAVWGPGYTGMRVAITTSNTDGHPDRSVSREIRFELHKPFRLSSGMAAERTLREARWYRPATPTWPAKMSPSIRRESWVFSLCGCAPCG